MPVRAKGKLKREPPSSWLAVQHVFPDHGVARPQVPEHFVPASEAKSYRPFADSQTIVQVTKCL